MAEGERLVGSGSFRVDLRAAVEKLKRYRDPKAGPLMFWTRCAVAAGATRLVESLDGPVLKVSFDGEPLPASSLSDPLGALFADAEPHPAARQFALGVLHAWRPGLRELTVVAGRGDSRQAAALDPAGGSRVTPAPSDETDTVLTLTLAKRDKTLTSHPRRDDEVRCPPQRFTWAPCVIESWVDGSMLSIETPEPLGPTQCAVRMDGVGARFSPSPTPAAESLVDVYHHGVFVGPLAGIGPGPAVLGKVEDARLTLNISQGSLLDAADQAALGAVVERGRLALAVHLAKELPGRLPAEAARLRAAGPWPDLSVFEGDALRWLRAACLSPLMEDPVGRAALRKAPVLLDKDLGPVSLDRLRKEKSVRLVQSFDVRGFEGALNVWADKGVDEGVVRGLSAAASRLR